LPSQSLSTPENTLTISAVDSARPSIRPMAVADTPSEVARNIGSRLWIISEEMSMNMLTRPRAQMAAGMRGRVMFQPKRQPNRQPRRQAR